MSDMKSIWPTPKYILKVFLLYVSVAVIAAAFIVLAAFLTHTYDTYIADTQYIEDFEHFLGRI